jgi:YidC/Oxa1 family membrane protein insertase
MLVLSGCGVPMDGIDVTTTPPDGLWQTLVVWPLANALLWLHTTLENAGVPYHWGFAIIVFTLIIKIVTFPLTLTQMRGMQAQKDIQPKIQELQKKYGKDREKMAQEQMKLYQEAGVNPLSGCLPLIVQMPVLFGLYAALVTLGDALNNAKFFWIDNLGFPKYTEGMSWLSREFNAGNYGLLVSYLILPILLVISQFVMQKWMTPPTPTSDNAQAKMMQQMSLMMTVMFGFFTLQVPSGLTLYWVTSNLLQMLQQWVITSDRFNLSGKNTAAQTASITSRVTPIADTGKAGNGNVDSKVIDGTKTVTDSNAPKRLTTVQTKRRKEKRK